MGQDRPQSDDLACGRAIIGLYLGMTWVQGLNQFGSTLLFLAWPGCTWFVEAVVV